jgi:hypothetical protein
MAGEADFLVILTALYLLECFRKVLPGEFVFDRGLGSSHHIRKPLLYPGNGAWGWLILNPLRPAGPVFSAKQPSYALTKLGLLAINRANGDFTLADPGVKQWDDLDQRRFNLDGIATACKSLQNQVSWLRYTSKAMFILSFLIFPALVFFVGLTPALLAVLPLVIFLTISSAFLYRRAALLMRPPIPKTDLYGNFVKLLLYPLSILRCVELISYQLLSIYDPVAITAVLCGKDEAAKLAAKEIAVLRYSAGPSDTDNMTLECVREYRRSRIALLESFCY